MVLQKISENKKVNLKVVQKETGKIRYFKDKESMDNNLGVEYG